MKVPDRITYGFTAEGYYLVEFDSLAELNSYLEYEFPGPLSTVVIYKITRHAELVELPDSVLDDLPD